MAYSNQNPFGNMTPEQKLGATFALTQALSWINQPMSGGGSSQASSGNGTTPILTKTRAKRGTSTRGGTKQQHAQAGHEGGLATARKKVGRKSNAERALLSQQAQS